MIYSKYTVFSFFFGRIAPKERMGCICSQGEIASPSITSTNQERVANTTTATNTGGGTGGETYIDDDGEELVFYDAVQEFHGAVSRMSYAPTSTMKARGVSIQSPSSLMWTDDRPLHRIVPSEEGKVVASDATTGGGGGGGGGSRTARESVVLIREQLEKHSSGVSGQGYPGELNAAELDACLHFREELKKRDPAFREMVLAYAPIEEEAFGLCRFLRAREFSCDKVFEMLEGNASLEIWKKAREQNFYHDFEKIYGCPVPVFMGLFPFAVSGLAKNGATTLYFKSGNMNVDALECVADLPDLVPAMWDLLHTKGRLSMEREAKTHNPETTTVLAERIIIMDMKGMPSAMYSSRGMEFMRESAKITACFPETMNRTYLVNVPTSFSIVWSVIKLFVEARTLEKIGFFSNPTKAKQDLLRFINGNELLAEYGGTGPTFEEVLASQQKELGSCSRYIVQYMYVTDKESQFEFNLEKDERMDSVVVYSKAEDSANFTLKTRTTHLGKPTCVKRGSSSNVHYSVAMSVPNLPCGPGTYTVEAKGRTKGHYVVAISICTV